MSDDNAPLTHNDPLAMSAGMDRDEALERALAAGKYQITIAHVLPWFWAFAAVVPTSCVMLFASDEQPTTWALISGSIAVSALLLGWGIKRFMLGADTLLRNVYMVELIPRLIETGYTGPVDSLTFDSFSKSDLRRVRSSWRADGVTAVRARRSRTACAWGIVTVLACTATVVLTAVNLVTGYPSQLGSIPTTVVSLLAAVVAVYVLYRRIVHAVFTLAGQVRSDSSEIARSDQP